MIIIKKTILAVSILIISTINTFAQQNPCPVKVGSNYYLNCKHLLTFKGQEVFTVKNTSEGGILINFDVFNESGIQVAHIEDSKLKTGDPQSYTILSTDTEFSFVEKQTERIICFIKKMEASEKGPCSWNVWMDMYMPSGFYFQCTPETTNIESLNRISGTLFSDSDSAIQLR